jgi:hypothetical protein
VFVIVGGLAKVIRVVAVVSPSIQLAAVWILVDGVVAGIGRVFWMVSNPSTELDGAWRWLVVGIFRHPALWRTGSATQVLLLAFLAGSLRDFSLGFGIS